MLCIVIPTLNECASLPHTVAALRGSAGDEPIEIIVSDCDSPDGTACVARDLGLRVVAGGRSRADAMNRGAAVCRGDSILFLHADTIPPAGFARGIRRALRDPAVVGGAFEFEFGDPQAAARLPFPRLPGFARFPWILRLRRFLDRRLLGLVVFCNRFRYRRTRAFFGDQGIFVRRSVFDRLGGFPPVGLMEDVRFCQALDRLGKTAILTPPVFTSPRRFVSRGIARQFVQDMILLSCESWGVCPQDLWAHYNDLNHGWGGATSQQSARFTVRVGSHAR